VSGEIEETPKNKASNTLDKNEPECAAAAKTEIETRPRKNKKNITNTKFTQTERSVKSERAKVRISETKKPIKQSVT